MKKFKHSRILTNSGFKRMSEDAKKDFALPAEKKLTTMKQYKYNAASQRLEEQPTMDDPLFDYQFPPDGPSNSMLESAQMDYEERCSAYEKHLASLASYPVVFPDEWRSDKVYERSDFGITSDTKKAYLLGSSYLPERGITITNALEENEREAIAFAEWIALKKWERSYLQNNWFMLYGDTKNRKTTAELYRLFKSSQP